MARNIKQTIFNKPFGKEREKKSFDFWHLTPEKLGFILISRQKILEGRKVEYLYTFKDGFVVCLMCGKLLPPEHTSPLIFTPEQLNEEIHVSASFCPMCVLFTQLDDDLSNYLIKIVNRYRKTKKEPFTNQHLDLEVC